MRGRDRGQDGGGEDGETSSRGVNYGVVEGKGDVDWGNEVGLGRASQRLD